MATGSSIGDRWVATKPRIVSRWHAAAFIVVNGFLSIANAATGGGWWAFWPLLITAAGLGLHYMLRKSLDVNAGWVDERVEELNIKSYDRAHIEELKARLGPDVGQASRTDGWATRPPDRGDGKP
jgi:hypothetical protein